jgi:hypothetical protein
MVKQSANKAPARRQGTHTHASAVGRQTVAPPEYIANLVIKERAWEQGRGRALYPTEEAELHSWKQFPNENEAYWRDLAFKKVLSDHGAGPPLSCEEMSDLLDSNKLPKDIEREFRELLQANTKAGAEKTAARGRKR